MTKLCNDTAVVTSWKVYIRLLSTCSKKTPNFSTYTYSLPSLPPLPHELLICLASSLKYFIKYIHNIFIYPHSCVCMSPIASLPESWLTSSLSSCYYSILFYNNWLPSFLYKFTQKLKTLLLHTISCEIITGIWYLKCKMLFYGIKYMLLKETITRKCKEKMLGRIA